jgi:hypothetical protein
MTAVKMIMARPSDLLAGRNEHEAQAHAHQTQDEHRGQPNGQIHDFFFLSTPLAGMPTFVVTEAAHRNSRPEDYQNTATFGNKMGVKNDLVVGKAV